MFCLTGLTNLLVILLAFATCIVIETRMVTQDNSGPSCSVDNLPGKIIGCVNHEQKVEEVNKYATRSDIQADCLIWYENVSTVYACKNYQWVAQSEKLAVGVDEKYTVLLRRHKRFLGFLWTFLFGDDDDDTPRRCVCYWREWLSWSSCTTSCLGTGGTKLRRLRLEAEVPCYQGCLTSYEGIEITVCNSRCYKAGDIVVDGSPQSIQKINQLNCECPLGKTGTCCQEIVSCETPSAISHGSFSRSWYTRYTYGDSIHYSCERGYYLNDPSLKVRTCTKYGNWSGQMPSCVSIYCGTPSAISHGSFSGSGLTYGNSIQYSCDIGYYFNDHSLSVRTCTENGLWSGEMPSCVYDSCRSGPCRNGAVCVRLDGGYSCTCGQFWTGKSCEIDILPPVTSGCPSNRYIRVSNKTSVQSWNEPIFHDPRGHNVVVTKNYPVSSYEFPWGVYTVQYTAVKPSNGLSAECTFQITIQPHPCPKLPVPKNGLIACNGWQTDYAQVCKIYCLEGFSMPPYGKTDLIYSCGSTGSWRPATLVQECVRPGTFVTKKMPTFRECGLSTDDIRLQYITDLKHSQFNALCLKNEDDCIKNNVTISCQ